MDEAADAFMKMRAARLDFMAAKANPDLSQTSRNILRIRYFDAMQKAVQVQQQRQRVWNEALHPRDVDGKFTDKVSTRVAQAKTGKKSLRDLARTVDFSEPIKVNLQEPKPEFKDYAEARQWLTSQGFVRHISGHYDAGVLNQIGDAMVEMRQKFPWVGNFVIQHKVSEFPGFNMIPDKNGGTLTVYGDANMDGKFEEYATGLNEFIGEESENYGERLRKRSAEQMLNGEAGEAKRFKFYSDAIDHMGVKPPKRCFAGTTIKEAIIHEIGHKAHYLAGMAGHSYAHGKEDFGHARDENGEFDNQIVHPNVLNSAYKLGTYAATSLDEYFAEAFMAYHSGKKALLDEVSRKYVESALDKIAGQSV